MNWDINGRRDKNSEVWSRTNETTPTDPQILFTELCVNLLREGGKICIVLPEGVLGNPTQGHVRQWILNNLNIFAIWDCPQNLFLPHTNTKTCILFAEKGKGGSHEILMSVIKKSGHDSRGAEIRSDDGNLVEDFSLAVEDWRNRPTSKDKMQGWTGKVSFITRCNELTHDNILVPRIYRKVVGHGYDSITLKDLYEKGAIDIRTVPCNVRQKEYCPDSDGIQFVRTSDLGVMELRPTIHKVHYSVFERNQSLQDIQPLDILIVKDGTYRIGETVMLLEGETEIVLQGHFFKVRVLDELNPYYLYWALMKVQPVILDMVLVQATVSSITKNRLLDVAIPFLPKQQQKIIGQKMKKILRKRKSFLEEYGSLDTGSKRLC